MPHPIGSPAAGLEFDLNSISEDELIAAIEQLRSSRTQDIERSKKTYAAKVVKDVRVKHAGSKALASIEDLAAAAGIVLTADKIAALKILIAAKQKKEVSK